MADRHTLRGFAFTIKEPFLPKDIHDRGRWTTASCTTCGERFPIETGESATDLLNRLDDHYEECQRSRGTVT